MDLKEDSDIMAIIKMSEVFGKYHNLAWAYVELFGIRPMGKNLAKVRSVLDALKMIFQAEAFTFERRRYQISQAGIAEALNVVVLKNFDSHLEGHNYLKKVMIGIAERESTDRSRQGERDLRKKEDGLRSGYSRPAEQIEAPAMKTIPTGSLTEEEIAQNKLRVREAIKKIGG